MKKQNPTGPKLEEVSEWGGNSPHILQAGSTEEFLQRIPGDLMPQQAGEGSLSLEQWEAQWQEFLRTVENPHSGCGIPQLPEKLSPWEDAKAFLASFEQVAEACQWSQEEWVTRLLPALSGEVKQAFNNLDIRDREDYGKVKAAILRWEAMSREKQREEFRHFCYQEAEGPRGAYSRLQEMCRGWLRMENHSKEQILELLILEQLLSILPPEIQSRVRESGPQSCSQAVSLAEEFLLRQEKPAVARRVSKADQEADGSERRHPSRDIKEEKEREVSSLAGGVEAKVGELHGLSWGKVKKEEAERNAENPDGPERQEENHAVEKRDQPIPCQAEYFEELLVQQEEPSPKRRDKHLLSVDGRIHTEGKQSETVESGNHMVKRKDTSILYQAGDFSKIPIQEEMPPQKRKNKGRRHTVEKQNENKKLVNSFVETRSHTPHQRSHTEENHWECLDCGMSFSSVTSFNEHLQTHNGEKLFRCFECGKDFGQKSHLGDHQRSHAGKKPHSCSECGKSFSFKSSLIRHQVIHSEDKRFNCSECGKSFSQKTKLTSHQRIHMVEEPYKCSECGLNFLNQTQFNLHLRMHHGKKLHRCSECGKSFLYRAHLLRHQRMHTGEKPYDCSECGKSFSAKSYLVIHQRIHSGEKPYKCSECTKRFRTRDKLTVHHRSHTGEKPYTCLECGKKFTQKKYLQRHQTIHTRGIL